MNIPEILPCPNPECKAPCIFQTYWEQQGGYIECHNGEGSCGYTGPHGTSEAEAIRLHNAICRQPTPEAAAAESRRCVWLLERRLFNKPESPVVYFRQREPYLFTVNPNEALQFATKEEAEAVRVSYENEPDNRPHYYHYEVHEHIFLDAAHPPKPPAEWMLPSDMPGLIDALKRQKQCDEDGVECQVSRQAVDEAIQVLEQHLKHAPKAPEGGK